MRKAPTASVLVPLMLHSQLLVMVRWLSPALKSFTDMMKVPDRSSQLFPQSSSPESVSSPGLVMPIQCVIGSAALRLQTQSSMLGRHLLKTSQLSITPSTALPKVLSRVWTI